MEIKLELRVPFHQALELAVPFEVFSAPDSRVIFVAESSSKEHVRKSVLSSDVFNDICLGDADYQQSKNINTIMSHKVDSGVAYQPK